MVLAGDVPLLRTATLVRLVEGAAAAGAAATVLTCVVPDAGAYGRIVKDAGGRVIRIVEARDATPAERAIGEYNTGVFCFRTDRMLEALANLTTDNDQGEYYLTDTVAYLVGAGEEVAAVATTDPGEVVGINTVDELAAAERLLAGRGAPEVDRLCTPWRFAYVSGQEQTDGCVFCNRRQGTTEQTYMLHRGQHWYLMLNLYPYNGGHLLLVLGRHAAALGDCTPEELQEMARLLAVMERPCTECFQPDGINCGYNGGSSAGAGIPEHLHLHMLPRWAGDTNFMSTIGETRVMPLTLDQAWARLQPVIARLAGERA